MKQWCVLLTVLLPISLCSSAPGVPQMTSSSFDSITVTWSAPLHRVGNFIGYYLLKRQLGKKEWHSVSENPIKEQSYTVTGLTADYQYEFKVSCINERGESAYSASSHAYFARPPLSRRGAIDATPYKTKDKRIVAKIRAVQGASLNELEDELKDIQSLDSYIAGMVRRKKINQIGSDRFQLLGSGTKNIFVPYETQIDDEEDDEEEDEEDEPPLKRPHIN